MEKQSSSEKLGLGKSIPWKKIAIITILTVCIIGMVFMLVDRKRLIAEKDEEITTWKAELEGQKVLMDEKDQQILDCEDDKLELQKKVNEYTTKYLNEKRLTTSINCLENYPEFGLAYFRFSYWDNESMHRELVQFVEAMGDKVATSDWNPIWNNVDVAMHKISVEGNFRYYFLVSFTDRNFPDMKNSIYWLDYGCFLDHPEF